MISGVSLGPQWGGGSNICFRIYREKSLNLFSKNQVVTCVEALSGTVNLSLFKSRCPKVGRGYNIRLKFLHKNI